MDIDERKRQFFASQIGSRTREQLANELWQLYLLARANAGIADEPSGDSGPDPWPEEYCVADMFEKYVLRRLKDHSQR